jgi:pimeloyl-ACP methyl ester carboxylesterase
MIISSEKTFPSLILSSISLYLLAGTLLLSGCANPVGVKYLSPQEANQKLSESVLSNASLSAPTQQLLNRSGLAEQYDKEPAAAIESLRQGMPTACKSDRYFALAELSFLLGSKSNDQAHYLAAALYAYAFLFPEKDIDIPTAFDPRLVTAVNIYNQGLSHGLSGDEEGVVDIKPGNYPLPFGMLKVHIDPIEAQWGPFVMERFYSAAQLDIRGLRNDYRWPGIGSAMVASLKHIPGANMHEFTLVPGVLKVAVTAFILLDNIEEDLEKGVVTGEMTLHTTQEGTSVEVRGRSIPLEFRPTSALAFTLEKSQVYDLEIKGLLSGDLNLFKQASRFKDNVFLMAPFQPNKIPLVLVHGTASSPARWAEVLNEILNDPVLLNRYQVWLFTYNTGNPVFYSGGLLAKGIRNIVKDFDPEGKNEALRKMVIIGHSQGGLLTKLTAIDSGNQFWDSLFTIPFEQIDITQESRDSFQQSFFYQPLPCVKHVIFISTPHRGSFLAMNWVGDILQKIITLPFQLLTPFQEILFKNPNSLKHADMKETVPRSTDNMNPDSAFIKTFAEIPLSPGIQAHSIIAVHNPEDPQEKWNDGVVDFKSAHIDGVASELIVHSGHSAQDNPEAIEEIRRILMKNLFEP